MGLTGGRQAPSETMAPQGAICFSGVDTFFNIDFDF
jgi:hypothetical protein